MKKLLFTFLGLILCASSLFKIYIVSAEEEKAIKIGVTSVSNITYEAIKDHYEKLGYKTEAIMFDTNPVLLEALAAGEIDISLGQHKVFVENFSKTKGVEIEVVKPYGYYTGIGLYSEKYTTVEEIPNGATIAIMNDSMNMNVGLRMLEEAGFIKVSDNVESATIVDIEEYLKDVKIVDMEQQQTVSSLKDVDAATVFFTHMSNAGLIPDNYIIRDNVMINYPMGPIVKSEFATEDWAVDYAKCFKIEEVQSEIEEKLPGVFEFYEDDSQVKE
ncbi:methionine-binding protein [Facklamia sp. DSM 111018]|uniref:Methionine-binding protein n=1 Tax=Facklamia lactis TaxID=2749967 RepID=A0ABS0LSD0_9LACT|nr:MetQ/NlpA family ABC transporter substrate-binding protein [Facklamia lactis]MBG9986370.1 methionine-binding protein [Facklamia lactis]